MFEMESVEKVGALKVVYHDDGTEPKTAHNTDIASKANLKKSTCAEDCLVMAVDNNTDHIQPQEQLQHDQVSTAAEIPRSSGVEANITNSSHERISVVEVNEPPGIQSKESVETISLKEQQQDEAFGTHIDENAASESDVSQIAIVKSTCKSANVSVMKPVGSLGLLVQYVSSSEEEEEEEDDDDKDEESSDDMAQAKDLFDKVMSKSNYRIADDDNDFDETESECGDSDVECVGEVGPETIDITNDEDLKAFMDSCDDQTGAPKGPIKAKGEFGLDDLPPIADLTITVPESECIQLGTISGVVETLVLVESLPNFAAVDIDTVLFLDKGNRTLGQVFDVMGNVASPIYCVRFNKTQDIVDKKVTVGEIVYVAPKTEHTNFIVLSELMNQKGTDASWEDDIEPPTGCGDFSDDEEERVARRTRNQQHRNRNRTSISSDAADLPLPSKVTVKQEPFYSKQRGGYLRNYTNRNPRNNDNTGVHQFYKDNRGYANTPSNYMNFHHNRQPMQYDHSWHTAGTINPPLTTPSMAIPARMRMPMPQGCYPNPFAMPTNPMNYGYFNLQAFPPLPPPMCMQPQPPSSAYSQRTRNFNNQTINKPNGSHTDNQ